MAREKGESLYHKDEQIRAEKIRKNRQSTNRDAFTERDTQYKSIITKILRTQNGRKKHYLESTMSYEE